MAGDLRGLGALLSGSNPEDIHIPPPPKPRPVRKQPRTLHLGQHRTLANMQPSAPVRPMAQPMPQLKVRPKTAKPKKQKRERTATLSTEQLWIGAAGLCMIVIGLCAGLYIHATMFGPKSPFSSAMVQRTAYPLAYPTDLPKGFSIDKKTISQTGGKATIFAIKNKQGALINVSLQPKPQGIDLTPVFKDMTGVHTLPVPMGTATVGVSDGNARNGHILSGNAWIIVRTGIKTVTPGQFEMILKSFVQG